MNDMIIRAAQDPSCILAVTPDRGGSWWSRLRPPTPRKFSAAPMVWSSFETLTAGYNGDFIFRIVTNFRSISDNPQKNEFFFNSRWVPFAFRMNSETRLFGWLNGSDPDAGVELSIDLPVSILGMHVLKVARTGLEYVVAFDGEELYRTSVDTARIFPEPASTSASRLNYHSDFDGSIAEVDFSAPALSWSAPHGDLYDTSNPWPSPVPRNFDDVTAAWYDAVAVGYAAIGDHDCEFEISYKNNVDYPGTIFYSNSQAGSINLHQIKNNQNTFSSFRAFNETYPSLIIPLDAGVQNSGSHIVKFKRQNGTAEAWVDGQLVKSVTSDLGNKPLYADNVPASHFDGNIFYIRLTDLTTGRTVWSYPSEAERVRLLTTTNVRTDRGVFEAADTSKRWSVTTQLRAAALIPECTIIVEADNPGGEIVSYVSCAQLLNPSQGFFVIRRHGSSQLYIGYSGRDSSGGNFYPGYFVSYPAGERTVALVIDYTSMKICCYINGVEVYNRTMHTNIVAQPEFDETAKPVILGVTSGSDGLNLTSKISHCLIFDRALTAAEIAAFGVRRPRNFAEKTMTWTEFSPDKITINTQHDYEFLIQFSSNGQLPPTDSETQLFYSTDNKMLAGVWIAKDGQIRGYLSVYEYNALMIHEIGEPALSAGIHTIRILAVGNTMSAYLDDELMNSAVRNRRTDFSEITSYPISSFDGNLLCAKLTDLTTGENVWRANHNDLFTY